MKCVASRLGPWRNEGLVEVGKYNKVEKELRGYRREQGHYRELVG